MQEVKIGRTKEGNGRKSRKDGRGVRIESMKEGRK